MGQGKPEAGQESPLPQADSAGPLIQALIRIAEAIESHARATELLAQATAGEMDDPPEDDEVSLSGRRYR